MRAMVIDRFGPPEVLHWGDIRRPKPGEGEVLVQVGFTSVNPADCKARRGLLSKYIDYHFPFVLGFDLAGTVAEVGPGVTKFRPGDRVFGTSRQGQGLDGSYAEYCIASEWMLAPLPEGISLAEAAALPTAGTTAFGGLVDVGGLKAGQSVLINGGAGGVGSIAIQIARAVGARIAATCSPANVDYVQNLGADFAIDYRGGNMLAEARDFASGGFDLVLDAVGLDSILPHATELVRPGGTFVEIETLISEAGAEEKQAAASLGVTIKSNMVAIERLPVHLAGLAELVARGAVRPPVAVIMPLQDIAEAHRQSEAGHVRGKIVIEVTGG